MLSTAKLVQLLFWVALCVGLWASAVFCLLWAFTIVSLSAYRANFSDPITLVFYLLLATGFLLLIDAALVTRHIWRLGKVRHK